MRLLIATTQVPFVQGGAEIHAQNLQAALRAAGHEVETVAVPFKWYPPERMLDAMLACRLLDLTESCGRKIDRVIGLKFPAYLIPHPNKVLWILHQHRQAYEQWDHPLSDMVYYGNGQEVREAIRRADTSLIPEARAVFTNSQNVSRRLKRFCGLDSTPLYHPPHQPDAFYCGDAEPYFFFPSRINASKRQLLAIQALAHAGGDVRLVICGESEDDAFFQALQREVCSLGLEKRVTFWAGSVKKKSSGCTQIAWAFCTPRLTRTTGTSRWKACSPRNRSLPAQIRVGRWNLSRRIATGSLPSLNRRNWAGRWRAWPGTATGRRPWGGWGGTTT